MYKVRYIERVGTPGRMLSVESDDELKTLTKGCKLYKNGVEIQSPEDGCTIIRVPKGGGDAASKADLDTMQRGQDNFSKVNDAKTANSVRGSKNQFRDGRIPIVLGEHRLTPDLVGKPYTTYGKSGNSGEKDNEQYLHQLFCLGYNNVKIIDNSEKIGDMPISENPNISMEQGTKHYNRLVSELSVGEKIEEDPVFRITPENTTQITVGISFPSGLRKYNNENGAEDYNGEAHKVTFHITLEKAKPKNNPSDEQKYVFCKTEEKLIQANSDCVRKDYLFQNLESGTYRVIISRSANSKSGSFTYQDRAYWDFLQSDLTLTGSSDGEVGTTVTQPIAPGIKDKLTIISLKTRATDALNGTIEEFNVMAQSTCPDYEQPSSGSSKTGSSLWKPKATRNPASILLYILRDPQINRNPVEDSEIEWEDFVEYWKWCNRNKFYFDAVFTDEYTVLEIANMITQASMASLTRYNGKYGIALDNNSGAKVDFHLTPKNTMGSTQMSKPFAGNIKNLKCKFVDSQSGYSENEALISVTPEGTITYEKEQPGDTLEATFTGITDANQLRRVGRFELLKATRRVVTYSVQQDWEYLTAYPGAVGYLANDMLLYGIQSGRIRSVQYNSEGNISSVVLDESVRFDPGTRYSLVIRHNDESLGVKTYKITSEEPQTNIVIFQEPVESLEEGDLYTFSEHGKEALQVLCTSVAPSGDHSATLELVEYRPEIYTIDDQLPPWNSFITIPNGQSNPGWEKEVPPYIPPAKPGEPAKDIRLTSSEVSIHSSGRGVLIGDNITLQCKLFNMDHKPLGEILPEEEGSEERVEERNTDEETPLYTTITWDGNGLSLTDTEDPLVKIIDLRSEGAFEYIRQKGNVVVEITFTNTDGKTYRDSLTLPIIYDGQNGEYLGTFNYLPESTLAGEPLLEGDWFLVQETFFIASDSENQKCYRIGDVYEYRGVGVWSECQNSSKISQTLNDMAYLQPNEDDMKMEDGKLLLQRLATNQAFINALTAQTITIPSHGSIQSEGFEEEGKGFRLDGDGTLTAVNGEFRGRLASGYMTSSNAMVAIQEEFGLVHPVPSENNKYPNNMQLTYDEKHKDTTAVEGRVIIKKMMVNSSTEPHYTVGERVSSSAYRYSAIVFYDKGDWTDGWRYLVCESFSISGMVNLSSGKGVSVENTIDNSGIGGGEAYTNHILDVLSHRDAGNSLDPSYTLPYRCKHKHPQEYFKDWYMPNKEELIELGKFMNVPMNYIATSDYMTDSEGVTTTLILQRDYNGFVRVSKVDVNSPQLRSSNTLRIRKIKQDEEKEVRLYQNAFIYQEKEEGSWKTKIDKTPITSGVPYSLGNGLSCKFLHNDTNQEEDSWEFGLRSLNGLSISSGKNPYFSANDGMVSVHGKFNVKNPNGTNCLAANDGVVAVSTLHVTQGHDGHGDNLELLIDSNQIESRHDATGAPSRLHLQYNGGELHIGASGRAGKVTIYGDLEVKGKMTTLENKAKVSKIYGAVAN